MKFTTPLLCLTSLFIGAGIGSFLPFNAAAPEVAKPLVGGGASRKAGPPIARSSESAGLGARTLSERNLNEKPLSWDLARGDADAVMVPVELLQKLGTFTGGGGMQQSIFDAEDRVIALLNISDDEKSAIQQEWSGLVDQIRELEISVAEIDSLEDGSARINLPENSAAMGQLALSFETSLAGIVGENRAKALAAVKNTNHLISSTGEKRSYTIALEPTPNDRWRYKINYQTAEDRKVWVSDTLPLELRHLSDEFQMPIRANEEELEEPDEGVPDEGKAEE